MSKTLRTDDDFILFPCVLDGSHRRLPFAENNYRAGIKDNVSLLMCPVSLVSCTNNVPVAVVLNARQSVIKIHDPVLTREGP